MGFWSVRWSNTHRKKWCGTSLQRFYKISSRPRLFAHHISLHQSASTGKLRGMGNCSYNISKLTVWILVLVGIYEYYVIFYPWSLYFLCKPIFDSALISSFLDKTKAVVTLNRTKGCIDETLALFLLSDINVLIAVLPEIVDRRIQYSRDVDCSYSTRNHSPSVF